MKRLSSYWILLLLLAFLSGCNVEQKLARKFVLMDKPMPLLVMKPEVVFKNNLKAYEIPGIDSLSDYLKDSLLFANSLFIKDINDSLLVNAFYDGFERSMKQVGYRVLPEDSLALLMTESRSATIINLAQISLEEYIHPYRAEEVVYDEVIVVDGIDLNAINYNIWIELSKLNSEGYHRVLFTYDYLMDDLNGLLKQHLITGKFRFDYTIDTITLTTVYEFAGKFGSNTAGYLYDYLLNNYV
ncbi:MAG: hypothetical protein K0B08_07165, partial [Bacteroidales bacterium]|nr:hypothetical protein [Bacteroidales bacterium]